MMPRIFIVDDDPALRDALRKVLETAGLQVETYANGASTAFWALFAGESMRS